MTKIESLIGKTKTDAFWSLTDRAHTVALFCHVNPDGDTCGSALALAAVLRKEGKIVELYCPSPVGGKLTFLDGWESFGAPKTQSRYDLGIAIDCGDTGRMGECAAVTEKCDKFAIVDHHKTNNMACDLSIVRPSACATAELVFMLLSDSKRDLIDPVVAKLLFSALVTDSGGFSFSSVSADTYRIGAELIDLGAKQAPVFAHFLKSTDRNVFELRNRVLSRARFFEGGKIGVIAFFADDFAATQTTERDTDGIVNFVRDVNGVKIAVSMSQTDDGKFKVSIRTDDDVDASFIASVFNGGGHFNAAGCRIPGDYEEVLDRLLKTCRDCL